MVLCPHCQSDQVIKGGKTEAGKQRYKCQNVDCPHYSFQLDLTYKGRSPEIKALNEITCFIRDEVLLEAIDELTTTVLALMVLFAVVNVPIFLVRGGFATRTDLSEDHTHGELPVLSQRFDQPSHGMSWPALHGYQYLFFMVPDSKLSRDIAIT